MQALASTPDHQYDLLTLPSLWQPHLPCVGVLTCAAKPDKQDISSVKQEWMIVPTRQIAQTTIQASVTEYQSLSSNHILLHLQTPKRASSRPKCSQGQTLQSKEPGTQTEIKMKSSVQNSLSSSAEQGDCTTSHTQRDQLQPKNHGSQRVAATSPILVHRFKGH